MGRLEQMENSKLRKVTVHKEGRMGWGIIWDEGALPVEMGVETKGQRPHR